MIIHSIEVKNFGKHQHKLYETLGAVVGLIGGNGSGKTTILDALAFCFTSTLGKAAESYVRYFGKPHGATNASVRTKFTIHGEQGEIFRQIGKTPKRELTWKGVKYTASKEVEPLLLEILGCDRNGLSSAVFIGQGVLAHLIHGTPGERLETYRNIMGLGHVASRETQLGAFVANIRGGMEDLTQMMDSLRQARAEATESLREAEARLARTSGDMKPTMDAFDAVLEAERAVLRASADLASRKQAWQAAEDSHRVLRGVAAKATGETFAKMSGHERETLVNGKAAQISGMDDILAADALAVANSAERASLEASLASEKEALADARKALDDLLATHIRETGSPLANAQDLIDASAKAEMSEANRKTLAKALADAKELQGTAERALAAARLAAQELPDLEAQAQDLEERIEAVRKEKGRADTLLGLMKAASHVDGSCGCPLCGSKDAKDYTAEIKELEAELKDHQAKMAELMVAKDAADSKAKTLRDGLQRAISNLEDADRRVQQAEAELASTPPCASAILPEAAVARMRADIADHSRKHAAVTACERRVTEQYERLAALPPAKKAMDPAVSSGMRASLQTLKDEVAVLREHSLKLAASEANLGAALKNLDAARTTLENSAATLSTVCGEREALLAPYVPDGLERGLPKLSTEAKEGIRESMRKDHERWCAETGALEEAKAVLAKAVEAQRQGEARVKAQEERATIVRKLQGLQAAFATKGLAYEYMQHKFKLVARQVRETLAVLESNFVAEPDEEPLTFRFRRLDEDTDDWLPQSALSGGQSVRLAVAFLLAVQAVLLPKLGLLVLDEPSQHLDEAGKESLRDLIMGLSARLGGTESQVWVCDHAPVLESAFDSLCKVD